MATRCSLFDIERPCATSSDWSARLLVWLTVLEIYTVIYALFWYFQGPASTVEQRLNRLVSYIARFIASLLYQDIRHAALATITPPSLITQILGDGRTFITLTSSTASEIQSSTTWLLWTRPKLFPPRTQSDWNDCLYYIPDYHRPMCRF